MSNSTTGWLGWALIVALILTMVSPLGACGRKSSPDFPGGSEYPHEYPKKD